MQRTPWNSLSRADSVSKRFYRSIQNASKSNHQWAWTLWKIIFWYSRRRISIRYSWSSHIRNGTARVPNSSIKSELILFSSELHDLQVLSQSKRSLVEFRIVPDISDLPPQVNRLLGGISSVDFTLELFTVNHIDYMAFENKRFSLSKSFEGWLEIYNSYKEKLSHYIIHQSS